MSKKIIALSILMLCVFACWCDKKDKCLDRWWSRDSNIKSCETSVNADDTQTNSDIQSVADIFKVDENSENNIEDEIPVADEMDWLPVVISEQNRNWTFAESTNVFEEPIN